MTNTIFDRHLIRQHRNRAASKIKDHNFLTEWTLRELESRLSDIKHEFPTALQIGAGAPNNQIKINGNNLLIKMDMAEKLLPATNAIQADEECLPLAENSLDLILSPLTLHSVNDLPGTLIQIRKALKPDGLFLGALFGENTLHELRTAMSKAEIKTKGGVSPHIFPFANKQQMGALMQRAGFALPVIDSETLNVSYAHPLNLMKDLRGMGEGSALSARSKYFTGQNFFKAVYDIYVQKFTEEDGRIPATFEIIFLIGWSPHENQQKPLPRGSATHSLADRLRSKI